jgi:ParB family chromosome partitioning protein
MMQKTSSAVASEKVEVKTVAEKVVEKVAEKRRALGRGLESLLPGPRVVPTSLAAPVAPPAEEASHSPAAGVTTTLAAGAAVSESGRTAAVSQPSDTVAAPSIVARLQASADGDDVVALPLDLIDGNPHQTRTDFGEEALKELADSIRVQGVIQPIVVRPSDEGRFKLILGERRFRASRMAGMETIRATVKRVSEQQAAEMTLVENLQRQDLNCVEQAVAFQNLSQDFKLTQEEIGARVGVSRETVANYIRLLVLPEGVIGALQKGKLTYSHARALLQLRDNVQIWTLAKKAMEEKLSVAKLEELVMAVLMPHGHHESKKEGEKWVDPNVKSAQRSLEATLGVRVRINDRGGKGKIMIEYASLEDFDRVVDMLKGK